MMGGGAAVVGNGGREKEEGRERRRGNRNRDGNTNLQNFQVSRHLGFPHFSLDTRKQPT